MTRNKLNSLILAEGRQWIGTPYIHQASLKGVGADCLGLVRGVWRKVYGSEPQDLPSYTSDWGEISQNETLMEAANKHFEKVNGEAKPADIVLFRWRESSIAKHVGILTGENTFIHAYERGGVVETKLGDHWRRKIAQAYRFILPKSKMDNH